MPTSPTSIVVHYQELALKGRNRPWFVERLVRNIREATADLPVANVRPLMGRLEIVLRDPAAEREVSERLKRLPGVANFATAGLVPADIETLAAAVLERLEGVTDVPSFRVSARRADKRFPMTSPDIERALGGRVQRAKGWKVNLSDPALRIHVEVVPEGAFFFLQKERGPGGLPTGVGGRVVCLLSGGIDSPVAAWRMMRRGCRAWFVHFHSYPVTSQASEEKARELVALLTRHQLRSRLLLVPFADTQRHVVTSVPPPLRVVIYRRMMFRMAERVAAMVKGHALVTGEVLGQVASQTIENLQLIDEVVKLPVLRPLVGMDKEEITDQARALGTYPISILPDEDCCQVFTPRRPATRAQREDVEQAEAALDIDALVERALRQGVMQDFRFPALAGSGPAVPPAAAAAS